jgi:general secretion pathway protein B
VPAAATASASEAPAATATATASPVRSFAELAPDVRARLPAVNVSGSTYSQNPAHRMLIVNGKVVQEGGEISPGLKLETIEQRSAVLNHQGMRYRIGY